MKTNPRGLMVQAIKTAKTVALIGVGFAASLQANISSPITIYSTGVNSSGLIPTGGTDGFYKVISSPGAGCNPDGTGCAGVTPNTTSQATVVDLSGAFPFPYWASNGANSQWISLTPGNTQAGGGLYSEPEGQFVYQTTFTLPSNFVSANLSGSWGTDNQGLQVTLNGTNEMSAANGFNPFPAGTFNLTQGFVTGTNTLDFYVNNLPGATGNPEGLRVEFTSATYTTPEPGLYGPLSLGVAGLVLISVRRRKA